MSRLSRRAAGIASPAPVRVVHLGLGAFHRAHQAWYTHHANDANSSDPSGIAAFTGRRPDAAIPLREQEGLYHTLVRDPEGNRAELMTSISAAHDGADIPSWCGYLATATVSCVTLTVTEAAYRRDSTGALDTTDSEVRADVAAVTASSEEAVTTVPGRLVQGLDARRRAGAGPVTIVPCDNLVDNGPTVQRVVSDLARLVGPDLAQWIEDHVSFVSTTIDRITPATTDADRSHVAELTGWRDQLPVVTEPFTEWILAGDFPAGRPAWEHAGARFVDDVGPFEQRKLWLLNGAHSLLAYAAPTRGHRTVAEAVDDPTCRGWIAQWWDEACAHLTLPADDLAAYRQALLDRFANPNIRHNLAQIAMDGSQKLPIRVLPVLARKRARGMLSHGATYALAGWLAHLRDGQDVNDPRGEELTTLADGPLTEATPRVLAVLDPTVAEDTELVTAVREAYRELTAGS